ncbi:large conductance mechanosensitive channel protein MscL [Candidatus Oscillochloris fontis]|uniref:large conductance mechanosensitive channel protein MscL n=1 Tax=Candidatus Oscillochloris fontis TaxID=2496868 RepID=UPI00101D4CB4|nr:large conductance mechanosensitive channel protein MscL [Candidatus Oscillochloris fontis]
MFKGFRDFVLRGNVLDLAIGVIIGIAFGAIINSLSADVLMPVVGLIFGQPDFSAIVLGPLKIGNLLNAMLSFLMTAFALYFFVVAPMNMINERQKSKQPPVPPATRTCPECLSEVPIGARRCAFCTSELPKS